MHIYGSVQCYTSFTAQGFLSSRKYTRMEIYESQEDCELIAVDLNYKPGFNVLNQKNLLGGNQLPCDTALIPKNVAP